MLRNTANIDSFKSAVFISVVSITFFNEGSAILHNFLIVYIIASRLEIGGIPIAFSRNPFRDVENH